MNSNLKTDILWVEVKKKEFMCMEKTPINYYVCEKSNSNLKTDILLVEVKKKEFKCMKKKSAIIMFV